MTHPIRQMLRRALGRIESTIPNDNTVENNLQTWTRYDWSKGGEEWSNRDHPQWKKTLIRDILLPQIPQGARVLEIGPGAGRWTEQIIPRSSRLFLVDLTPTCIDLCRRRFEAFNHIEFHVNDGRDLSFISKDSIDRIWSFDVFVHILAKDVHYYVKQFADILVPGGRGVIHHSRKGRYAEGWRSDMTAELMRDFCQQNGLVVLDQIVSWDDGRMHLWPHLSIENDPDIITIFEKQNSL